MAGYLCQACLSDDPAHRCPGSIPAGDWATGLPAVIPPKRVALKAERTSYESDLNKRIQAALYGLDPVRVENTTANPGTPDINYIGGWVESKQIPEWPKRASTPLRVPHYTPQQRGWHVRRRAAGGRCHVIIEVADEVFVFDAAVAAAGLGQWTREEMRHRTELIMRPWSKVIFRTYINHLDNARAGQ